MWKLIIQSVFVLWGTSSNLRSDYSCTVSATGVNFGNLNPFIPPVINSQGNLQVNCNVSGNKKINYTATLNRGSGTYAQRIMNGPGTSSLPYNLYTDATYSQVWGDGSSGTSVVPGGGRCFFNCTFSNTIYGRLIFSSLAQPGIYTDNIVATVSY